MPPAAPPIAYSAAHVRALTGLSRRQLAYWQATGFFPPHDVFTLRDLLALALLARLRNHHKVPLQSLRKVGRWLAERRTDPWADLRVAVDGREVLVGEPDETGLLAPSSRGQTSFAPPGATVIDPRALADEIARAAAAQPKPAAETVRTPGVLGNAPRLAGTRVPVPSTDAPEPEGRAPVTLQLLVDEPVPASVVVLLRERGHAVHLVADVLPPEPTDALVAAAAKQQGWTLVTWNHALPRGPSQIAFHGDESRARALAARYLPKLEQRLARARRPVILEVAERVETTLRVLR